MSDALDVVSVGSERELEALARDYERLYDVMPMVLPFQRHEWHLAWWRALRDDRWALRDRLNFKVIRRRSDGACVAVAPLLVSERPGSGPLRARMLQLIGADPNLTELRTILVDPAYEAPASRAIVDAVHEDRGWDVAHWHGVPPKSTLHEALMARGSAMSGWGDTDHVLDLAPTFDDFRKSLKRNIRESLRHCYNSLKRDGRAFSLEVAEEPKAVEARLETFFQLHAMRASLEDTTTHPNYFASPRLRGFLHDVAIEFAHKNVAKVFTLIIDGKPAASRVGFVLGKQLYLYYSGFDPELRKYSVATTNVSEAIRWAIEHGLTSVNLSVGTDVSKTRWGARSIEFVEVKQQRPTLRSRAVNEAIRVVSDRKVRDRLERFLPRRRWD